MKVGRLKRRTLTSYFLTSGHRRGLVVLIRRVFAKAPKITRPDSGAGFLLFSVQPSRSQSPPVVL
jgi:hypothetical protein